MMKTNNPLIENWQKSAKMVYDAETNYLKVLGYEEDQREWTFSNLAMRQLLMIQDARPDKTKPTKEQLNNIQLECYEYLEKVVETNEI